MAQGALPPVWKAEPGSDDGVLWTCRDIRPWKHVIQSDFVPYIWLGGGERGLAFFGANDKGYLLDPKGRVQTIERRGDTLYLRVDLVNKPSVIGDLVTSPSDSRPVPRVPCPRIGGCSTRSRRATPGPVVCWGGYLCAEQIPRGLPFQRRGRDLQSPRDRRR